MNRRAAILGMFSLSILSVILLGMAAASSYLLKSHTTQPPDAWFSGGIHAMSDAECSPFPENECSATAASEGCLKLYEDSTYVACASLCTVAATQSVCVGTPTTGPYGCAWIDGTCVYVDNKPPPLSKGKAYTGPFLTCTKLDGHDSWSCGTTKTGSGACASSLNVFRVTVLVSLALCVASFGLLFPIVLGKHGSGRFGSTIVILLALGTLLSLISAVMLPKIRSKDCVNLILPGYAATDKDATLSYTTGLLIVAPAVCLAAAVVAGLLRWHKF